MHVGVAMPGRVKAVPGGGSSKSSSAAAGRATARPTPPKIIYCTAVAETRGPAARTSRWPRGCEGRAPRQANRGTEAMMNDIRWSEHPLYADVVKRVPPELHPTLARAVDLRAADAWLHEGTMPAGLDSDGKSLGGQQGPAFLRAAGRRYMRRWVTNEHGEQFGKGEAGMLLDKWLDEMLAFSAGLGGRGRGISWLPGRVEEIHVLVDSRSGEPPTYRYYTVREVCESKALAHFLGLYARRRRHKTYERIERAREDERIPLNRKARETLAWVLANRVMHDEDEL